MQKLTKEELEETKKRLKDLLPVKDAKATYDPNAPTVYAIIRSVAPSGMSRRIDFYTIAKDHHDNTYSEESHAPRMQFLTGYIAQVLGYRRDRDKDGILVKGCGMDMAFAVTYELSMLLYDNGYALKSEIL